MKITLAHIVMLPIFCCTLATGRVAAEDAALRGSFMDRELRKCNFVCPKNSEKKAERNCMDSFDDCACDLGYFKTEDNECVADAGLCTEESIERIQQKQKQVYGWLAKAKEQTSYDEKMECIDNLNNILSDVWIDYNAVKASCEQENDGGRRLAFGGRFVRFFKDAGKFFVDVAKDVGDFVVGAIDDAKCFLVGGVFKVVGISLDIALTIATGGANKLSKAACTVGNAVNKNALLAPIAVGISSTACALNKKIKSDVLRDVCNFRGDIEAPNNRRVLRFAKTFQGAVCGQPGRALGNILEDLVDCEINCASQSNVFCGN